MTNAYFSPRARIGLIIACITTATAVLEAFRAVGIRKTVLASPYRDNLHEIGFLEEAGIQVLHDRALGLTSDGFIAEPPSTWVRVVTEEADPEADGYFLS